MYSCGYTKELYCFSEICDISIFAVTVTDDIQDKRNEPWPGISNNVVLRLAKPQISLPIHGLIRAFATRLNIL